MYKCLLLEPPHMLLHASKPCILYFAFDHVALIRLAVVNLLFLVPGLSVVTALIFQALTAAGAHRPYLRQSKCG
jgi:hypothetical protein